jgi:PAS domain S-box-containing protein
VDDEPDLLEIAKLFLEKTSEFKVFTALSAKQGLAIVQAKKPQAIVSDYQMPEMDGMAFLKEVRKTSSVPFIMFTGRGNELVAMEATNSGADYYIQKGADPRALFAELTYKLRLALADRRSESEEQRTKKTIRTLIDKTYDAVIIHTPEGRIYDVNDKLLKMFHITRQEALTYTIADLTGPDAPVEKRTDIITRVLAGEDQFLVWEAKRPHDGSVFPIEKFLTRINFGPNYYVLCNIRDISMQERTRVFDEMLHFAIDHTSEGIICTDTTGHILFMNQTWSARIGLNGSVRTDQMISDIDPSLSGDAWKEFIEGCRKNEGMMRMSIHHTRSGEKIPVMTKNYYKEYKKSAYFCSYIRPQSPEIHGH